MRADVMRAAVMLPLRLPDGHPKVQTLAHDLPRILALLKPLGRMGLQGNRFDAAAKKQRQLIAQRASP